MMDKKEKFLKKLVQIPHLNLTQYIQKVKLNEMLSDLQQFKNTDYLPYQTATKNKEFFDFLAKNWQGMCLIDSVKNGKQFMDYTTNTLNDEKLEFNFNEYGRPIFLPTDVGKLCPNILEYCYNIVKSPKRTRLSRLVPQGHFHWHSHKVLSQAGVANTKFVSGKYSNTIIMHIVLKTNSKCWMGVSNQHPFGGHPYEIYKQHYGLGEVWILNGDYYHNVFNGSDEERDHIMLYADPFDKNLYDVLEQCVEEYNGPLLTDDIIPQRIHGELKLNLETGLKL